MTTRQAPSPQVNRPFLTKGQRWIMGVLNATPDSFYAAARAQGLEDGLARAERLVFEGADIVDIGGESTRPGSRPVSLDQERERVIPLIEALHEKHPTVALSVDTQKAALARESLSKGATCINDITALRYDPEMAGVVAAAGCPVVLMHMQGAPETMQQAPRYENVVEEVLAFFEERLQFATRCGIAESQILLDPGIGFGKSMDHNLELMRHIGQFKKLGRPLLVGVSRKNTIGQLMGTPENPLPPEERLEGSIAAGLWMLSQGADGLRVHDVGATRRAMAVWQAIEKTQ